MHTLTTRETCQCLRDAALGVSTLHLLEQDNGLVHIDIDGWHLTLDFTDQHLHHCENARSPDGREGNLDTWHRYGTNPVNLLSTWELAQVERLLKAQFALLASSN